MPSPNYPKGFRNSVGGINQGNMIEWGKASKNREMPTSEKFYISKISQSKTFEKSQDAISDIRHEPVD